MSPVCFAYRETLPLAGFQFRFGITVDGDQTWSLHLPGHEDSAPLRSGFWSSDTPAELAEIGRAMRHSLKAQQKEGAAHDLK